MNKRSKIRLRGLLGAAAALAAIAVAVPAISAADHHGGDHHGTVGTIESFDAETGTLVITPTSGDDVSGMVNDRTKINCEREDADDDNGDDGPNHDNGDDHGDDRRSARHGHSGGRGNCSPDDLTAGSAVSEADLEIGPNGLVYEEVELR
jgi:hypothetical protein